MGDSEQKRARVDASREFGGPRAGRRVLLAEDDTPMRCLLALALRADGFEVIEATTGGELMERIAELVSDRLAVDRKVDLVITDLRLPMASGLEALFRLRQRDRTTPVILITAFGDRETHAAAARLNAHVFDKPFDLEDLRMAARYLTT